ncbi:hypothetical protein GGS20DRAFT_357270 [Poronia punctata]|nr:hypothetical protein GGS20DRAFT_357270 [Poronia punctata]
MELDIVTASTSVTTIAPVELPESRRGSSTVQPLPETGSLTRPKRKRQRAAGKRTVKSCTACRAAHVRCVADRYGVPCGRCERKFWLDCTLMELPPEKASALGVSTGPNAEADGLRRARFGRGKDEKGIT